MNSIKIKKFPWLKTILFGFSIYLLILGIVLLLVVYNEKQRMKEENLITYTSSITNVIYNDDNNEYLIELADYDLVFRVSNTFDNIPNLCQELKIGDNYNITFSGKKIKFNKIPIIYIHQNNTEILSLENNYNNTNNISFIVGMSLIGVSIILFIIGLVFKNKNIIKEYDYFEYMAKFNSSAEIIFLDLSEEELKKRRRIVLILYGLSLLILLVGLPVLGIMFSDYWLIIIISTIIYIFADVIFLFKGYGRKFYKAKDVSKFVIKYNELLNSYNFVEDKFEVLSIDGYRYVVYDYEVCNNVDIYDYELHLDDIKNYCIKEHEIIKEISYSDLKLYTGCYFTNDFHSAHIFILSDYTNDDNPRPLIIKLNSKFLSQIRKNNIDVAGLDYLFNNLEKEIIDCHKNKIKFKKYN